MEIEVKSLEENVFLEHINSYLSEIRNILKYIDSDSLYKFYTLLMEARSKEKNIFIMGNGGSAATASHMATDLMNGSSLKSPALRSISLSDNNALLTATGNDLDFNQIFARQISCLGNAEDIIIAISASGNSPNLIQATKIANNLGMHTVGIIGMDGGTLASMVNLLIHVPTKKGSYGPAEDIHLIINHIITSYLNKVSILEDKK